MIFDLRSMIEGTRCKLAVQIINSRQSSALNAREIKSRTAFFGSLPS